MNLISRTITGGFMIAVGLTLIAISFFTMFLLLIYGLPIFVIGIIIFLNNKEDKIEKIKNKKEGNKK